MRRAMLLAVFAAPPVVVMVQVVNGVNRWGLTPECFAGGHGSVGNYADLARLAMN